MDSQSIVNFGPLLQYGFAGFALIQLVVFGWVCLKFVDVLSSVRDVVAANTAAMGTVDKSVEDLREEIRGTPCRMTVDQLRELVKRLQPLQN